MTPTELLMREWLVSGTEIQKAHARFRLSVPLPEPRFPYLRKSAQALINTCPYRDCARGCRKSKCHAGKGDQWAQVTLGDCWNCLNSNA